MAGRIWVDVEDVFEAAAFGRGATGIQRVQSEVCRALIDRDPAGAQVGFVRHDPARQSFRVIASAEVTALFERLQSGARSRPVAEVVQVSARRTTFRRLAHRLPPHIRQAAFRYLIQQRDALHALAALLRACFSRRAARAEEGASDGGDLRDVATSGDVLVVLGAVWYHPDYAGLIRRACEAHGVRFATLVYDAIPLRRPEWCERGHARLFRDWFVATIGLADHVLTISEASAADIERAASERGLVLRGRPVVLPMGSGFAKTATVNDGPPRPPPAGRYVLTVATLEARKNHILLFRVWRRLLDALPADQVPTLVLAGRVGWMVDDLLQELRNCDFLGGKIVLFDDATDAELEALYGGCQFTVFPSFYEGWGLPVTESLAFGRPCIASNATSLPEAGGTLARYFDPDNAVEAYAAIRAAIADPVGLAGWRARVAMEFRPVPWSRTAASLLAAVQAA